MESGKVLSRLTAWRPLLVRWGIHAGLGLALLCAAVSCLTFVAGWGEAAHAMLHLGVGLAIGWAVAWAVYEFTVSRPLAHLAQATEALAGTDAAALSVVLAAVAEGDLTRRVELRTHGHGVAAGRGSERGGLEAYRHRQGAGGLNGALQAHAE